MTPRFLSRKQAAAFCGLSLWSFDLHVRPALTVKKIGRLVRFLPEDLEAWAVTQKDGPSVVVRRVASTTSVSRTAESSNDPLANAIAARLKKRRLASTQTTSNGKHLSVVPDGAAAGRSRSS